MNNYFLLIFICFSCVSQNMEKEALELNTVKMNFNVDMYFSKGKSFKEYHLAIKDEQYSNKRDKGFEEGTLTYWQKNIYRIDSVFFKNTKRIKGIQYNINSYHVNDTIAYFDNISFFKICMMKSVNNEFMALVANRNGDRKTFIKLVTKAKKLYGEPEIMKNYNFGDNYSYSWGLKDKSLVITSRFSIENKLTYKITKDFSYYQTRIYLINNKYKDSITKSNRLTNGEWLYLN